MRKSTQRPAPPPASQWLWQCQGHSVLGASHQRSGLPNQDAIAWSPESGAGPPLILAIADGHGSAKSFRSDRGSKLAVQVAIREITKAFHRQSGDPWPSLAQAESIAAQLPQAIVQRWQQLVEAELQSQPILNNEWQHLQNKEGHTACGRVEKQPLLAYGATLLALLITDSFILFLQLGDGDILCVDGHGHVSLPLSKDSRLIANETTSLCQDQAWKSMQWRLLSLAEPNLPELILLSTDGYANCFVTEADFQQIGPDYQQMLREQGLNQVMTQLPTILQQASQRGSGDDITLGLIQRYAGGASSQSISQTSSQPRSQTSQVRPTQIPVKTQVKPPPALTSTGTIPATPMPIGSAFEPGKASVATPPVQTEPDSLQSLQRLSQKQQNEIKRLKFWLNILLLTSIISALLAALSFWQLHASTRQSEPIASTPTPEEPAPGQSSPNPTAPIITPFTPSGSSPTPTSANPTASSTAAPGSISPGSTTSNPHWSLQVEGQPSQTLKPGHHLVYYPNQPGRITSETDLKRLGSWVFYSCSDCKSLAEVTSQANRLGLKNISGKPWQVTQPNRGFITVSDQDEIQLQPKMQIKFDDRVVARIEQRGTASPGNPTPTPSTTTQPNPQNPAN